MNMNETKFEILKSGHFTVTLNVLDTLSRHPEFSNILLYSMAENFSKMNEMNISFYDII